MRVEVEAVGLDAVARHWREVARAAVDLRPVGYMVRRRWHESERRIFESRGVKWTPRSESTLLRYRYPVRRWRRGGRAGTGRGPLRRARPGATQAAGVYTGSLFLGLTRPHRRGVRDSIAVGRGGLTAIFGIQGRGPLAHGNLFAQGAGSRPARPGVVAFDTQAEDASARDVLGHLEGDRVRPLGRS